MRVNRNNIVLSILLLLCAVSLTLAIKISRDIIENKRISTFNQSQFSNKDFKDKDYRYKLDDYSLIYSGHILSEKAFVTSNKIFVPFDYILKKNSIRYKIIDSDDVLSFYPDEKEHKLEIGDDKVLLPLGKTFDVQTIFKAGHIYCETLILKTVGEFSIRKYEENKSIFLYSNGLFGKINFNLDILKSSSKGKQVMNLGDLNSRDEKNEFNEAKVAYSEKYKGYFYIGENYVFDMNKNQKYITKARLSITLDGKNFYYVNKTLDVLVLLDVKCDEVLRIKNISTKLNISILSQNPIYGFVSDGNQKKILLCNDKREIDSALIDKSKADYKYVKDIDLSPDKSKMIYIDEDGLYLTDMLEQLDFKIYENVDNANWITNDTVLFTAGKEKYVYSLAKGVKESVFNDLKYLGKSKNGIYYKSDNAVMFIYQDKEKEVMDTQINIKTIIPFAKDTGIVIIPDSTSDSIYQYYKGELKRIGIKSKVRFVDENPNKFVSISPNEDRIVILEADGMFSSLNIIDIKDDANNFKISVDFQEKELTGFKIQWLDSNNFICYSDKKLFLIDTTNEEKIFSWSEENSKIEGVIIK